MLLEVQGLGGGYGKIRVLHDVSIAVAARETVCVLGPNGAGKSTLVQTIAGLLRPWEGRVVFEGEDVTGLTPEQLARRGLSLVRQGRSVFPYMTVRENLEMGAYLVPRARHRERLDLVFEIFPVLAGKLRQLAGSMSGGEQKMLEIGRSLMLPLKLLMLDEPSLGLAPLVVQTILARIGELNRAGLSVLLVEQNAFGALKVSARGYVLELGGIRAGDTSERLAASPEIAATYLGVEPVA
jgi:branched-chain amino acid transport system ATP-binding protein